MQIASSFWSLGRFCPPSIFFFLVAPLFIISCTKVSLTITQDKDSTQELKQVMLMPQVQDNVNTTTTTTTTTHRCYQNGDNVCVVSTPNARAHSSVFNKRRFGVTLVRASHNDGGLNANVNTRLAKTGRPRS